MRCLVVVLSVVACVGSAAGAAAGCALAEEFSARHNATADDGPSPGPICGGQCCGRGRETNLRASLQRLASRRVSTSLRPVAELLLATRRTLQEHLIALSHQSQNKTALLFSQVYRGHPARAQVPLSALYEDIRTLLRSNPDRDVIEDVTAAPPRDLVLSAKKFFREAFPVVYHVVLKLDGKQFTPEYEVCLKDAYDAVQPFDELPQQVESSLSKSLEAARALLQVLAVGAATLGTSEQILTSANLECSDRLTRVAGCGRCRNHAVAPCRSYCLNVARGCIGSLVWELDAPWAGYVEGVERAARADADAALRALDERVSKAIMHAIENHVMLEKKVRQECGPPSTTTLPGLPTPRPAPGAARRDVLRAPPPDTELLQFAASLASTKKLFLTLADGVCEEPDFAHDGNEMCWNGEAVGQYSKPLVASASLSDQRYNPEVPGGVSPDQRVSSLGHQLRQARQLLVSHAWSASASGHAHAPSAEAFMQGDEAGYEGSGSGGQTYPDDDAAYDAEGSGEGEEGSGQPDLGQKSAIDVTTYVANEPPKPASSATTSQRSLIAISACTCLLVALSRCAT